MGTLLEELQEHETFKNKASGKANKILKSLFRRVDWMKTTLGVGKLVADVVSVAREVAKKVEDI